MTSRLVIVTGQGRCGSTMAMQMLRAGGVAWAPGANRVSGEHPSTRELRRVLRPWPSPVAVKVLDPGRTLPRLPRPGAWVWLRRDPLAQAASMERLVHAVHPWLPAMSDDATRQVAHSIRADEDDWLPRCRQRAPLLRLDYEAVRWGPWHWSQVLGRFLAAAGITGGFDADAAAAVVNRDVVDAAAMFTAARRQGVLS